MLQQAKPGTHPPTPGAAYRTIFAPARDQLRRHRVQGPASSQLAFRPKPLKYLAPRRAGIAIAVEFGQSLIQDLLFGGAGPSTSNDFLLLQLAKFPKDLVPLIGRQLRELGKDFRFTHREILTRLLAKGKERLVAAVASQAELEQWKEVSAAQSNI